MKHMDEQDEIYMDARIRRPRTAGLDEKDKEED